MHKQNNLCKSIKCMGWYKFAWALVPDVGLTTQIYDYTAVYVCSLLILTSMVWECGSTTSITATPGRPSSVLMSPTCSKTGLLMVHGADSWAIVPILEKSHRLSSVALNNYMHTQEHMKFYSIKYHTHRVEGKHYQHREFHRPTCNLVALQLANGSLAAANGSSYSNNQVMWGLSNFIWSKSHKTEYDTPGPTNTYRNVFVGAPGPTNTYRNTIGDATEFWEF